MPKSKEQKTPMCLNDWHDATIKWLDSDLKGQPPDCFVLYPDDPEDMKRAEKWGNGNKSFQTYSFLGLDSLEWEILRCDVKQLRTNRIALANRLRDLKESTWKKLVRQEADAALKGKHYRSAATLAMKICGLPDTEKWDPQAPFTYTLDGSSYSTTADTAF